MSFTTRKPNRLSSKELYSKAGGFFVTICIQDRKCILGKITTGAENDKIIDEFVKLESEWINSEIGRINPAPTTVLLTKLGEIVEREWLNIPSLFDNITLDIYTIMPNHFHGIILFNSIPIRKSNLKIVDLSEIIRTFKAKTSKLINEYELELTYSQSLKLKLHEITKTNSNNWQKSFYDHFIRDEKDLYRIQVYIESNPLKWNLDILNPENENKYQEWVKSEKTLKDKILQT